MNIPASVLQALAAAVIEASLASCATDEVSPEKAKKEDTWDPCPACGMG